MKPQNEETEKVNIVGQPLSPNTSQNTPNSLYSETVRGITMSAKEKEDTLRLLNEYGIGLDVSVRVLRKKGVKCNKTQLHRLKRQFGISPKRVFDRKYEIEKQSYNTDKPKELVTHALDGYGLSNGSIKRRHHARGYVRYEDKAIIKMLMLVNVQTQKRYYHIYYEPTETTVRILQLIQKAIDNGENIQYLRMDRKVNAVIEGLEKLGITPIVYGKSRDIPYNSPAEMQFGNISKCFYSIIDKFKELDIDTATQLFEAILSCYWEYDDTKLIRWYKEQSRLSERVAIPNTLSHMGQIN